MFIGTSKRAFVMFMWCRHYINRCYSEDINMAEYEFISFFRKITFKI